jgi:hypothetical protein
VTGAAAGIGAAAVNVLVHAAGLWHSGVPGQIPVSEVRQVHEGRVNASCITRADLPASTGIPIRQTR